MIDYNLWEDLVAFAQYGTLLKTADHLDVTQPTLTHAMQKLEDELGVKLFDRQPNRISLTDTGKFAARNAKKILDNNRDLEDGIKQYDLNQTIITLAANAPGPLIVAHSITQDQLSIKEDYVTDDFERLLHAQQYTCLLINQNLNRADVKSVYLGTESLAVNLPKDNPLQIKKDGTHVSFADLKGLTFLSPHHIGFWADLYRKEIPNGKFIFQEQSSEYQEILNYSVLAYFTTNLTRMDKHWGANLPGNRILLPISDQAAHQQFYICFLKRNEKRLQPLIEKLQDQWATAD